MIIPNKVEMIDLLRTWQLDNRDQNTAFAVDVGFVVVAAVAVVVAVAVAVAVGAVFDVFSSYWK